MVSLMKPYRKCFSINSTLHLLAAFVFLFGISATLKADESGFKITSPISGVIEEVFVEVGQSIKKDQILLRFDSRLIDSNLTAAKAKLQAEKLNLEEAKKENERAEELYERTVLSDHDLQKAKIFTVIQKR